MSRKLSYRSKGIKLLLSLAAAGLIMTAPVVNTMAAQEGETESVTEAATATGSNATLKALVIDPGVLTPAFTPENTEYTITLDPSVTDITVSGGVSQSDSQITSASGFKGLDEESSEAQITVTAADGTTLTYHFNIVRGDTSAMQTEAVQTAPETAQTAEDTAAPADTGDAAEGMADTGAFSEEAVPAGDSNTDASKGSAFLAGAGIGGATSSKGNDMTILVGQNSYTIQTVFPDEFVPAGNSKTTIQYAGQSVEAVTLLDGQVTVVMGVSNVDGSTQKLFIYDAGSDSFQGFVTISGVNGGYIIPINLPESLPKGFVVEGCDIGGSYVTGGKLKDTSVQQRENICLLYCVDETGSQDYYLYDLTGGGYVHYLNYAQGMSQTSFNKRSVAIMIVLGVSLFVCVIIILVLALKKGEDYTAYADDYDQDPDAGAPADDYYDDNYDDIPPAPKKKAKKKKAAVREEDDYENPDAYADAGGYDEGASEDDYDKDYDEGASYIEERSSMPEPTVRKVKRKRAVKQEPEAYDQDYDALAGEDQYPAGEPEYDRASYTTDSFDAQKEIEAMRENAVKKSQTARLANVDAALKARSTTRTVLPQSEMDVKEGQAVKKTKPSVSIDPSRPKKPITVDNPPKKPSSKSVRTVVSPQENAVENPAGEEEGAIRVTKKVTEKGVTYTTGKIPITVVQPDTVSRKNNTSSVPIFTLGREEPKAPRVTDPSEPDTDFEFGYLNVDKK